MKKALLYFLLFAYSVSIIKPMLPFVEDAVAHAFFYQKHITNLHWKNGKSHVHHEFVNEAKKQNYPGPKKLVSAEEHIFSVIIYKALLLELISNPSPLNCPCPATGFSGCNFPPPKLSVA